MEVASAVHANGGPHHAAGAGMNGVSSKVSAEKAKRARRRAKKKLEKQSGAGNQSNAANGSTVEDDDVDMAPSGEAEPVQYVAEQLVADEGLLQAYADVFKAFMKPEELTAPKADEEETESAAKDGKPDSAAAAAGEDEEEDEDGKPLPAPTTSEDVDAEKANALAAEKSGVDTKGMSKKQKKKLTRLSVAELKQLVNRPDVVEMHDANAPDPTLLVYLKAYRNTVPVPKHWAQKRKYLQGKRGFEKPPFMLPQFIEDTGISKMRSAQQATDDGKKLKSKQRERMQPKMGKIDIDYAILHDAFFKFQTKPHMTHHGAVYYEGKEFEVELTKKKPGELSEELMNALGMVNGKNSPPPWLFAMQRYGPPPSYPYLKMPGVTAPIPYGCKWGTGDGEWGRAPVDEYGRPLWGGDLFGQTYDTQLSEAEVADKKPWGMLEEDVEEEEPQPDQQEEQAEEAEAAGEDDMDTSDVQKGIESTVSSLGLETPQTIQLRKRDGTGTETPDSMRRELYTVLEQKETNVEAGAMFGSTHTYVVPPSAVPTGPAAPAARARDQVDVALEPEELERLDAETLKRKYQQQLEAEQAAKAAMRVDVDEVIEEQQNKKKRKTDKDKKDKFKF